MTFFVSPDSPPGPSSGSLRDPLAGFTPRRPAVARVVLESLKTLAKTADPDTRRWAADVLAGRRPVREIPASTTLRAAAETGAARLGALDDAQRTALAKQGRALAEGLLRGDRKRSSDRG
jgi:hypothetical protein